MEESAAEVALPASLQRLWDRAGQAADSNRGLSLERIVAAAIEIADTEGLAALSMARLAERLGSAPMSLYRHVTSKDELYDFMIDAVGRDPEPPPADDWRTGLRAWAAGLMELYTRHPWILQLPVSRPPLEPGQLRLAGAGTTRAAVVAAAARGQDGRGADCALVRARPGGVDQQPGGRGRSQSFGLPLPYGKLVARLIDEERYPVLNEAVAGGLFDPPLTIDADYRAEADVGLELILDGVAAMINRRA